MRLQKGKATAIYSVPYHFLLWHWLTAFSSFVEILLLRNSAVQEDLRKAIAWGSAFKSGVLLQALTTLPEHW